MWLKSTVIIIFFSLFANEFSFAQQTPATKDSTQLYKDIETYSKRSKFTTLVYKMIFKPVSTVPSKKKIKKKRLKNQVQRPYSAFEGKTIRHINIQTIDPFGYSITDTSIAPHSFFPDAGNKLHIKTQQITIKNLLLIHQNQAFDSLLVKESERLVRTQGFVRDVLFSVTTASGNKDSVDILIREMDMWSFIPKVTGSYSGTAFVLDDKNFLGLGHASQYGIIWYQNPADLGYRFNYFVPNIRNTYINSTVHYSQEQYKNANRSFSVDRPFFSPFARWAAGVSFRQLIDHKYILASDSLLALRAFKSNTQDYWAGSAIRIFKGNTETHRTTNFISAVRFLRIRYLDNPIESNGVKYLYSDENLYLASIGISTRKYKQDRYIFKFGLTEDVPVGKVFSLTGGYETFYNTSRAYLGARMSFGRYYPWGYLSTNFEFGTFLRTGSTEQTFITGGSNYFTGLIEIGRWKFREFIKAQVSMGINRLPTDSITLNDGYGLEGFNSPSLTGTKRLLLTLQTQSYAPWNVFGFRFGPFLTCSFGMLGDSHTGFQNSKVFSQIGLGVLIKNENLIISTFQFSISYYPSIPGKGQHIFKTNSFKTTDFGFRDFDIGKPAVIEFQ